MTENNEMIADAIDRSLRQNEIVFLDASDFDDDFDDSDGDDWRVHVRI